MTPGVAVPLPMFPLHSPLVPFGVMQLHLFEPRYRALARDCTRGVGRLGIVLIERGSDVGGEDQRFSVGTVGRVTESIELPDGRWLMAVAGDHRIDIRTWLPDDPYPVALVEDRVDPPLDAADFGALDQAEAAVRRALDLQGQLGEATTPSTVRLADDPNIRAWHLCAIAPVVAMDLQRLLERDGTASRMVLLAELASDAADHFARRLRGL